MGTYNRAEAAAFVERCLEELIRERDKLERAYIATVSGGATVESLESADEFCGHVAEARKRVNSANQAVHAHYDEGVGHGFLTVPLDVYIRRVRKQAVHVVLNHKEGS